MNPSFPLFKCAVQALLGISIGLTLPAIFQLNTTASASPRQSIASAEAPSRRAVQSLRLLMQRHGCFVYSPITRFDFAAALNTCLSRINDRFLTKEDRVIAQNLQIEFGHEISLLKSNQGSFEVRTITLESQPFSNSTKTGAEVVWGVKFLDVQTTDWAYQSLKQLVERSGCLVGAPTYFQPHRAPTRNELALGFDACLNRLGDGYRFATQEDLAIAKSLAVEFSPELTALRGRMTQLQVHSETLRSQQFSPTTKVQGQVVITFQNGF